MSESKQVTFPELGYWWVLVSHDVCGLTPEIYSKTWSFLVSRNHYPLRSRPGPLNVQPSVVVLSTVSVDPNVFSLSPRLTCLGVPGLFPC